MSFINYLRSSGLEYVVSEQQFKPVVPSGGKRFAACIKDIVERNLSVYVDYDCDPDGYFSALCLVDTFKALGFKNYTLARHTVKRHVLSSAYAASVAKLDYDVVFILDSSTNNMDIIKMLTDAGKTCVVVDHHETKYMFTDYPANAIVVNPKIDALYQEVGYSCLSCGAIMSLLCGYTLQHEFSRKADTSLYLYGVITLYSDSMDLSNEYNIAFIKKYQNIQYFSSDIIQLFWDEQYSHFNRSYISFTLIPRLNALFRTENYSLLYQLFFDRDGTNLAVMKDRINSLYNDCKCYVARLTASCKVEEYENFVLAILSVVPESYAKNFTGLVANKLATDYNKAVICLHPTSPLTYHGSCRDPFSRDLLSLCKPLFYAEGHASAFGLEMESSKLEMYVAFLDAAIKTASATIDTNVIMNWDTQNEDIKADMQMMAEFNEFGGQGLPRAMGIITVKPSYKIYHSPKKINVYGDGNKYTCFVKVLEAGDKMIVSPTLCGAGYDLIVNNVHLD